MPGAVEALNQSFLELEESDVPANYVVRLRQEQAGLRKSVLRIYHIQREEFLPSAYAMIVSFVVMILALLMFTKIEGQVETLVTLAFLSFFFLYLLRLLNVEIAERIEAEETATPDESGDTAQEPAISDLEEVIDAAAEEAADGPPPSSAAPGSAAPSSSGPA